MFTARQVDEPEVEVDPVAPVGHVSQVAAVGGGTGQLVHVPRVVGQGGEATEVLDREILATVQVEQVQLVPLVPAAIDLQGGAALTRDIYRALHRLG